MTEPALVDRLAIIGIGLIGSSLARASAARGAAGEVALFDLDPGVRERARALGLGTVTDTIGEAVRGAAIVILCTPPGAMGAATEQLADALDAGAILTDVGSVKAQAIDAVSPYVPERALFVPGHPIAGTEQSGPEAGFAELFVNRWTILTPLDDARPAYADAVTTLTRFWERLGSRVEVMDPKRHDLVLAITSHIPHLIAFQIVATAADLETVTESEVVKYSAGGFRDFTRIAASDPTMWRDVFLMNREAVLDVLGRFSEDLTALRRAIRWGDGDALFTTFERARGIRREVIEAGQDIAAPNFGRNQRED